MEAETHLSSASSGCSLCSYPLVAAQRWLPSCKCTRPHQASRTHPEGRVWGALCTQSETAASLKPLPVAARHHQRAWSL